jgi:hypothetical protein
MKKSPIVGSFSLVQTCPSQGEDGSEMALQVYAPKLYKQFTGMHLTIVIGDGQTQPWKVGTWFLCLPLCLHHLLLQALRRSLISTAQAI